MLLTLLKNKGSLMVPGQGEWFYVEPLTFVDRLYSHTWFSVVGKCSSDDKSV